MYNKYDNRLSYKEPMLTSMRLEKKPLILAVSSTQLNLDAQENMMPKSWKSI